MVKFVNGREEVLLPEMFTADVAAVGVCKRLQVTLLNMLLLCHVLCCAPNVGFAALLSPHGELVR